MAAIVAAVFVLTPPAEAAATAVVPATPAWRWSGRSWQQQEPPA